VDKDGLDQRGLVIGEELLLVVVVQKAVDDSFLNQLDEFDLVDVGQKNEEQAEPRVFDGPLDENLIVVLTVEERIQDGINLISLRRYKGWTDYPS